ncbi:MAG: hypothetical protein Q4A52_05545 [Bacillota bacterium]|nr:hypothetical protein [Bacillota bacterium]
MEINRHSMISPVRPVEASESVAQKPAMQVGQLIEGMVISLKEDLALIQANGRSFWAQTASELTLGQQVVLEVKDIVQGTVLTSRVDRPETQILTKMGLSVTNENAQIVAEMLQADLPPTAENLRAIKQMISEVKLLSEELASGGEVDLRPHLDRSLRSILIEIMSREARTESETQLHSPQGKLSPESGSPLAVSDAIPSDNPQLAKPMVQEGNDVPMSVRLPEQPNLPELPEAETVLLRLLSDASDETAPAQVNHALRTLLREMSPQVAIRLLRNEQPMTIRNLLFAQMAPSASADHLIALAKQLPKLTDSLDSLLQAIPTERPLEELLRAVESSTSDRAGSIRNAVKESLITVKEQSVFAKQSDAQVFYMPVPMRIAEREERVDLYFKKRKRSAPNEFHVLVALKTHCYGEVRCVVSKQADRFELAFGLQTEADVERFEQQKQRLIDAIDRPGLSLRFRVVEDVNQEFFTTPPTSGGFDRRV